MWKGLAPPGLAARSTGISSLWPYVAAKCSGVLPEFRRSPKASLSPFEGPQGGRALSHELWSCSFSLMLAAPGGEVS